MAAAASLEPVSPELALVDSALATVLRGVLDVPTLNLATAAPTSLERDEVAVEAIESRVVQPTWLVAGDPIADLIVQATAESRLTKTSFEESGDNPTPDPLVQETDHQTGTSWYPALPAPAVVGPDPMDATEDALREIRERLTTPRSATRGPRFRRRFTVASGLGTACALVVFATNVYLGFTQLTV